METIQFEETISDIIINLLKDGMGNGVFKYFYYGDPYVVPAANLPCIAVEKVKSGSKSGPTGMDKRVQVIEIKLLMNKQTEFNKKPEEVHGARTLEQYAEGVNATTGNYDEHTVAGILRKNFTLNNNATGNDLDIDYGVTPRGNNQLLAVARITATIESLKEIPGRV